MYSYNYYMNGIHILDFIVRNNDGQIQSIHLGKYDPTDQEIDVISNKVATEEIEQVIAMIKNEIQEKSLRNKQTEEQKNGHYKLLTYEGGFNPEVDAIKEKPYVLLTYEDDVVPGTIRGGIPR